MNLIGAPIFTNSFADFGTATNIAGARSVKVVTAGGVSYAVVAGSSDSGFTVFRIGADMSLTPTGSGAVSGVANLEIVQTGGATILVFVGGNRLQTFLLNTAAGPSQGTVSSVRRC